MLSRIARCAGNARAPNQSPALSGNTMHSGNSEARSTTSNFNHTLTSGLTPTQACPVPLIDIPPALKHAFLVGFIGPTLQWVPSPAPWPCILSCQLSTLVICGKCMEAERISGRSSSLNACRRLALPTTFMRVSMLLPAMGMSGATTPWASQMALLRGTCLCIESYCCLPACYMDPHVFTSAHVTSRSVKAARQTSTQAEQMLVW